MADLLRMLSMAGQVTGLQAEVVPHEHEQVTRTCPAECLGLSAHVLNALRAERGRPATVGYVVDLLLSHKLAEVRNIGPRRVGEVCTALVAEGFQVPRYLM
ncbi:hypothetical protein [Actinomadura sp. 7K534]|uniref:hypothetical protein n=1 Tax=Actinomadura sp. 7K534 TaxID=2530366 RepID=UPI001042C6D8|nr:hypothetical protein [Actinomadura sp. 7K534]TDB86741.1 hypothetical protein E1266_33790 [Actinomadura sp. 7K534]